VAGRARVVAQGVAVAAVLGLLALLLWKLTLGGPGGAAAELGEGKSPEAPDFTLERLDSTGGELTLSSLRGKAVVLNFWASWCIPCKDEAPLLEEAWQENRKRGLVVVGVDSQDFREDARKFMKRFGVTYPIVYDGKGSTLGRYGVTGFPETFFVGRDGRLVGKHIVGGLDAEENRKRFAEGIELALASGGDRSDAAAAVP
jgi:cytochrome c biogenesis protein CcmG/thiol:disulfide interchange protein DsbE